MYAPALAGGLLDLISYFICYIRPCQITGYYLESGSCPNSGASGLTFFPSSASQYASKTRFKNTAGLWNAVPRVPNNAFHAALSGSPCSAWTTSLLACEKNSIPGGPFSCWLQNSWCEGLECGAVWAQHGRLWRSIVQANGYSYVEIRN